MNKPSDIIIKKLLFNIHTKNENEPSIINSLINPVIFFL